MLKQGLKQIVCTHQNSKSANAKLRRLLWSDRNVPACKAFVVSPDGGETITNGLKKFPTELTGRSTSQR